MKDLIKLMALILFATALVFYIIDPSQIGLIFFISILLCSIAIIKLSDYV